MSCVILYSAKGTGRGHVIKLYAADPLSRRQGGVRKVSQPWSLIKDALSCIFNVAEFVNKSDTTSKSYYTRGRGRGKNVSRSLYKHLHINTKPAPRVKRRGRQGQKFVYWVDVTLQCWSPVYIWSPRYGSTTEARPMISYLIKTSDKGWRCSNGDYK